LKWLRSFISKTYAMLHGNVTDIEINGGAVYSIDEVVAGKVLVEDVVTPQD